MGFAEDIQKFAKKTNQSTEEALQGTFISLFSSVILATPVLTGRLRGNWFCTINKPSMKSTEMKDPSGGKTVNNMAGKVEGWNPENQICYLTNNLPYAQIREDERGMVATNVLRIKRTLKESVRNVTN